MRELGRLSVLCPRLTSPRLKFNSSMGHLYTVFGVKELMHSQGPFGRIPEREKQMTSIHRKNRLRWCHTMKRNSLTDFQNWGSTDESIFEMSSQHRQFVRRPRGPVETRFMHRYLVKGCKGQIKKIMAWGRYGSVC